MNRYLLALFCLLAAPTASAESFVVDDQRIEVPGPPGFKNIIDSPTGKNFANSYQYSQVLALYVPEKTYGQETSPEKKSRVMVLTVSRNRELRSPMPLLAFTAEREGVKSAAKEDGAVIIYDAPRVITTAKLFNDTDPPIVSIGATVLLPKLPITLQVKSSVESKDDLAWATAAMESWVDITVKENPWTR